MKKTIGFLFLAALVVGGYVSWNVFGPKVKMPAEEKYFFVKTGAKYEDIVAKLKKKGIVRNGFFFNKVLNFSDYKENVKPGRYEIKNGMSFYSLFQLLKSGEQSPVKLVINKLRVPEDLGIKIAQSFECDSLSIMQFLTNKDSIAKFGVDNNTWLSAIIPNTYEINWDTPMSAIFAKIKTGQDSFWTDARQQKAKAKNLTPLQATIIASIVEEETNKDSDKPFVASVYKNRFLKGEKLQADPTVKFAMKDFALNRILYSHLEFASPYNTYKNVGLPPGPICTPTSKTIDAVLDAAETNYMFFVAKPDFSGYSNFAVTYAEHQVFAKAYQNALDIYLREKKLKEKK